MELTRRSVIAGFAGAAAFALGESGGAAAAALPHPRGGRLGLELYSVRNELKKDLAGTLRMVRAWGFEDVELAGFPPMSAEDTARALKSAGLRAVSMFFDWDKLRDDFAGVVRDARTLGLEELIVGWIPHKDALTRADTDAAIVSFNKWGAAARRENLRLGYHIHGYEFVPASGGASMMDHLFDGTGEDVDYEMDVFWVVRGGGDPIALLRRYGRRIRLVHLKDISAATPRGVTTGQAPDEASVPLGKGTVDWRSVMNAAEAARVKWYFIEDEHPNAVRQIPQSVEYLRKLHYK